VLRTLQSGLTPGASPQLLVRNRGLSPRLQTKLTINTPGDQYEQEADRVAEQVMRMPDPNPSTTALQRKCACGGSAGGNETCSECAKKELQRSASGTSAVRDAPPIVHDVLRSPGQPLDSATRAFFEPRFGRDFSGVRVHTSSAAGESAKSINANAYTLGSNVVFAPGRYNPQAGDGRSLLAHELVHTIQQHGSSTFSKVRTLAERRFGYDFSNVRAHADAKAAESAQGVGALAYTLGTDIVFGTGQYAPATDTGRTLIAHELTHVVQQRGGAGPIETLRIQEGADLWVNSGPDAQTQTSNGGRRSLTIGNKMRLQDDQVWQATEKNTIHAVASAPVEKFRRPPLGLDTRSQKRGIMRKKDGGKKPPVQVVTIPPPAPPPLVLPPFPRFARLPHEGPKRPGPRPCVHHFRPMDCRDLESLGGPQVHTGQSDPTDPNAIDTTYTFQCTNRSCIFSHVNWLVTPAKDPVACPWCRSVYNCGDVMTICANGSETTAKIVDRRDDLSAGSFIVSESVASDLGLSSRASFTGQLLDDSLLKANLYACCIPPEKQPGDYNLPGPDEADG